MEIRITGRNYDLNDDIKAFISKKISKMQKLYSRIFMAEVVLDEQKNIKMVEMILHLKRNRIIAKEESPDMYASLDQALDSVSKQLRRLNDKAKSRKRKRVFARFINPAMLFRQEDVFVKDTEYEEVDIVRSGHRFADKSMLPNEAAKELVGSDLNFIMFRNLDTGESNVLYKKTDGKFGLIEPKF